MDSELGLQKSSYLKLPERFYEKLESTAFKSAKFFFVNQNLAEVLELTEQINSVDGVAIFSGQKIIQSATPIAQAYAGHQFGHFNPKLGDGRARLLGQVRGRDGGLKEIHLKGSGPTSFSRNGDGFATLGSTIREFIVSQAMARYGVPTTQALAIISTQQMVEREKPFPGAILVRVASSHVRVGTFEYFSSRNDSEAIRLLADHVIANHYSDLSGAHNKYEKFFEAVIQKSAQLVAQWMRLGFIHGVMNTDNCAITGETIDYGPCAFMEHYDTNTVFSSIDRNGRYAYSRQPQIMQWNLAMLGYSLLPLFSEHREQAEQLVVEKVTAFNHFFSQSWLQQMSSKIGLLGSGSEDKKLIDDYLALLHKQRLDFTLSFRCLNDQLETTPKSVPQNKELEIFFQSKEFLDWRHRWLLRIQSENRSPSQIKKEMDECNPMVIPRNHWVEKAIQEAETQNTKVIMNSLLDALNEPYTDNSEYRKFQTPARPEEAVQQTFCGT